MPDIRHLLDFEWARLLALGSLGSFGACFLIWKYQVDVVHTQCARKFKEGHDGRIAPAPLQIADILLSETGGFGKALLGEAFSFLILPKFRPTSLRMSICASCVFTYYEVYLL
jgi:hypothetical protein